MKREPIIAIVFGVLLGAVVGAAVLFRSAKPDDTTVIPVEIEQVSTSSAKTAETKQKMLAIETPHASAFLETDSVSISGTAEKDALIVVQSQTAERVVQNTAEKFSLDFPLVPGENNILVSAYAGSSTPQEVSLRVYYIKPE